MQIAELKFWISYDPLQGTFTWLQSPKPGIPAGAAAGSVTSKGYLRIQLKGRPYRANRLAWFLFHGAAPQGLVDHEDGDRLNNRLSNLRDATHAGNSQNRHGAQSNSKTGVIGVCPVNGRYRASIQRDGLKQHLGTFRTLDEARIVREAA